MSRIRSVTMVFAAGLALTACTNSTASLKDSAMNHANTTSDVNLMPAKEWPLKFKSHSFSVTAYDTYGVRVTYAGLLQRDDDPNELRPSSVSYGKDYQRNWSGTHGMIRNFPPPAEVNWRSKDGQAHEAKIDIGEIFKDEVIRHSVPREEMADLPDGVFRNEPSIILEVNDRTIRLWMRAHIPTKEFQKPGNPYSDFRNDLIMVKTYTF